MDTRTLRQKLEAMAERGTPHEAAIAITKLAGMGQEPPRRPPITAAAPSPIPEWHDNIAATGFQPIFSYSSTTAAAAPFGNILFTVNFNG